MGFLCLCYIRLGIEKSIDIVIKYRGGQMEVTNECTFVARSNEASTEKHKLRLSVLLLESGILCNFCGSKFNFFACYQLSRTSEGRSDSFDAR